MRGWMWKVVIVAALLGGGWMVRVPAQSQFYNLVGPAGGDLTGTYPNPRLVTTGAVAGTYGNSTNVPQIVSDAKGRIVSIANVPISGGGGGGGTPTGPAGGDLAGTYPNPILATSGVIAGLYGDSTHTLQITYDTKGRATSVTPLLISSTTPSGPAGGTLTGTYPNPTIVASGVVAGSYTATNLTVGADGRITAAASGSGGGGVPSSRLVTAGTGLTGGGSLATDITLSADTSLLVTKTALNITWNTGDNGTGASNVWTFLNGSNNALTQVLIDAQGSNTSFLYQTRWWHGAGPAQYASLRLRSESEIRTASGGGGSVIESSDSNGYLNMIGASYNGVTSSGSFVAGPCSSVDPQYCPDMLVAVSDKNIRLATPTGAGGIDFFSNSASVLTILRVGAASSSTYWDDGTAPLTGTSTQTTINVRGTRIFGINAAGTESYSLGPTGMEIGGNYTTSFNPPRWPGDANDLPANATWANGSLRVSSRIGIGCGIGTSFVPNGTYPFSAALCVEPGPNGNETVGAEIWGPLATLATTSYALMARTDDTTNSSGNVAGVFLAYNNGGGSATGVKIIGSSTLGTDAGLWMDWDDQSAEYLLRIQASTLDRFLVKNTGAKFGAATNGGGGCGSADNTCGNGTANFAADIYKNGTAYTNPAFVFEKHYTGAIVKFADRERDAGINYQGLQPLQDVETFTRVHHDLPLMTLLPKGGAFARGDLLLASVEESYLYLFQLQARITALEQRLATLEAKER